MNAQIISDILRRLENLIRIGTIAEVDTATALVRVAYAVDNSGADVLSAWRPWLTHRAGPDSDWWAPEVGEQVLLLSPSGDLSMAIVLPAIYQDDFLPPAASADVRHIKFSDGAVIEYDRAAHHLKAVLPAGATTELVSDGGISIVGDIAVEGSITATVDITATGEVSDTDGTLSRLRSNYNSHKHVGNLGAPTSPTDAVDA